MSVLLTFQESIASKNDILGNIISETVIVCVTNANFVNSEGKTYMSGAYDDRDGVIWMDGEMINWRDAKVHILTHASVSYTHLTLPTKA